MRLNGVANLSVSSSGSALWGYSRSSETCVARPESNFSVMDIRSSRSANDL